MKCPLCSSSDIDVHLIKYPLFGYPTFEIIKSTGSYGRCKPCHLLFNHMAVDDVNRIDDIYRSDQYFLSKTTDHLIFSKDDSSAETPYSLQAELICRLIRDNAPSILDIGCFDGMLLTELSLRFSSPDLNGFDVNEQIRSIFPKGDNFHFWSNDLRKVRGKFDLICLSHSLQYIRDISFLMTQIKRLSKPETIIFVQAPDISKNPYASLYGDLYYYYTPKIMKNIFSYFGFYFNIIDNQNWFSKEITGIAKSDPKNKSVKYRKDYQIYDCIQYLDRIVEKVRNISYDGPLGILGTTINACFINYILCDKIQFFIDENPSKVGKSFQNKAVFHPHSLDEHANIIIPYGESSKVILQKFNSKYKGHFIAI